MHYISQESTSQDTTSYHSYDGPLCQVIVNHQARIFSPQGKVTTTSNLMSVDTDRKERISIRPRLTHTSKPNVSPQDGGRETTDTALQLRELGVESSLFQDLRKLLVRNGRNHTFPGMKKAHHDE
ncbi:hypothetical protein TKK_0016112 [Trichogramma kaykai]